MLVDVEVLDVNDDEARQLLLSIDPLAALADTDRAAVNCAAGRHGHRLNRPCRSVGTVADSQAATREALDAAADAPTEQFLILLECRDEQHQAALLEQFQSDGLTCRALIG